MCVKNDNQYGAFFDKYGFNQFMVRFGYDSNGEELDYGDGVYKWVDHYFGHIFAKAVMAQANVDDVAAIIKRYLKRLPTLRFTNLSAELVATHFGWEPYSPEFDRMFELVRQ